MKQHVAVSHKKHCISEQLQHIFAGAGRHKATVQVLSHLRSAIICWKCTAWNNPSYEIKITNQNGGKKNFFPCHVVYCNVLINPAASFLFTRSLLKSRQQITIPVLPFFMFKMCENIVITFILCHTVSHVCMPPCILSISPYLTFIPCICNRKILGRYLSPQFCTFSCLCLILYVTTQYITTACVATILPVYLCDR